MKVEPILKYSLPKYPQIHEFSQKYLVSRPKNKTLIAALMAVSGTLSGCYPFFPAVLSGVPAEPPFISEQEMIQIFQYEAEKLGITFDKREDVFFNYYDANINLDLYHTEKQIGIAVIDQMQAYEISQKADNYNIYDGVKERVNLTSNGSNEDELSADVLLTIEKYNEGNEEGIRQAFREFIEWLQSEGII